MITISIRDYTTDQLKDLVYGLSVALDKILERQNCHPYKLCVKDCEAYAICNDVFNTRRYLYNKILEREALEISRDTQERGVEDDNN